MIRSIEGEYRNGKIELLEPAPADAGGRVIITFLPRHGVDLASRGIDQGQPEELRSRLAAFAEDWQRDDMDVYDAL